MTVLWIVLAVIVVLLALGIVVQLPEIRRYLKVRQM